MKKWRFFLWRSHWVVKNDPISNNKGKFSFLWYRNKDRPTLTGSSMERVPETSLAVYTKNGTNRIRRQKNVFIFRNGVHYFCTVSLNLNPLWAAWPKSQDDLLQFSCMCFVEIFYSSMFWAEKSRGDSTVGQRRIMSDLPREEKKFRLHRPKSIRKMPAKDCSRILLVNSLKKEAFSYS